MHGRHFPATPHGERECRLRDPGRTSACDFADRERHVRRGHELARSEKHGTVGIEAFGVLAHDHEIERYAATRRKPAAGAGWSDIGKQVESLAQLTRWIEPALGDRRI